MFDKIECTIILKCLLCIILSYTLSETSGCNSLTGEGGEGTPKGEGRVKTILLLVGQFSKMKKNPIQAID